MSRNETIIQCLSGITEKVTSGEIEQALMLWKEFMQKAGRCDVACPFSVSPEYITCAHCLTGKLLTIDLHIGTTGPKETHYANVASALQDWIESD